MAVNLWKTCNVNLTAKISSNLRASIRNGHHMRGKPPGIAKSLQQKLAERNYKDPSLHFKVDIGLPPPRRSRSELIKTRSETLKANRRNDELEKLSRSRRLLIDLEDAKREWSSTTGPHDIKRIAEHYGVYEHLFDDAYFVPRVGLDVGYDCGDFKVPVCFGNVVKPSEAAKKPKVGFESDDGDLWTLVLTNPDGHLTECDREYVHWFVGNIPGGDVDKGEVVVDYLQPFPPKGTGYHRHIFVLYKQDKRVDYSTLKKDASRNLSQRTFQTLEFYRQRQDCLTPAGLAFFQSDWDKSLTDFYHNVLEMKEPVYEYDFTPPYVRPQEWFPLRKPFNLYMDKYRDPKQINKEFMERKLKDVHPFRPAPKALVYPNAQYFEGYVPSWLKLEKTKSRLKWGRINDIE